MTQKSIKRAVWFFSAWAFSMAMLFSMAWLFDVPTGQFNSWRFMGLYAAMLTLGPPCAVCLIRGMGQK